MAGQGAAKSPCLPALDQMLVWAVTTREPPATNIAAANISARLWRMRHAVRDRGRHEFEMTLRELCISKHNARSALATRLGSGRNCALPDFRIRRLRSLRKAIYWLACAVVLSAR